MINKKISEIRKRLNEIGVFSKVVYIYIKLLLTKSHNKEYG